MQQGIVVFAERCAKTAKDANRRAVAAAKMLLQAMLLEDRTEREKSGVEGGQQDMDADAEWNTLAETDSGPPTEDNDEESSEEATDEETATTGGKASGPNMLDTGKGGSMAATKKTKNGQSRKKAKKGHHAYMQGKAEPGEPGGPQSHRRDQSKGRERK